MMVKVMVQMDEDLRDDFKIKAVVKKTTMSEVILKAVQEFVQNAK